MTGNLTSCHYKGGYYLKIYSFFVKIRIKIEYNAEGGYSDVGVNDIKVLDIPCNESTCEICLNSISNLREVLGKRKTA